MADANLDDSLGSALLKALDRLDIREKLADTFAERCTSLINETQKKTDEKIEKIIEKTDNHDERITQLEKMADDTEQDRRSTNLIIKGMKTTDTPKRSIANILSTKVGITTTEDDIKYVVKINNRNKEEGKETYKFSLYDRNKRDRVYANRMLLKNTNIYLSEDLTINKSKLFYDARNYTKTANGASTWTVDGKIYLKDDSDARPRVVNTADYLKPLERK